MAGVSDTPGSIANLGAPKWQVYQIHLAFQPILDPENGRCIRYTWLFNRSWTPKMAGVSNTPGFIADLGPPKMAGVSDRPGSIADLGPRKLQVYQIHLAF